MNTKHTPEPWHIGGFRPELPMVYGSDGQVASDCSRILRRSPEEQKANAERIVACVNALAGLNPEAIKDVVEALESLFARTPCKCEPLDQTPCHYCTENQDLIQAYHKLKQTTP
jgi:hypothetical protein